MLLSPVYCFSADSGGAQGTGLTVQYYDNADFTTFGTTRVDTNINFIPGPGIPAGTSLTSATNCIFVPAFRRIHHLVYITNDQDKLIFTCSTKIMPF